MPTAKKKQSALQNSKVQPCFHAGHHVAARRVTKQLGILPSCFHLRLRLLLPQNSLRDFCGSPRGSLGSVFSWYERIEPQPPLTHGMGMKINIGCRFTRARRATLRQGDPFGVSANSCRPHHVAARRVTKQLGILPSCFHLRLLFLRGRNRAAVRKRRAQCAVSKLESGQSHTVALLRKRFLALLPKIFAGANLLGSPRGA